MACTTKEIAVEFKTTSPLFNFSASVAYPKSTAQGLIPVCVITANPIVLHTIQVDNGDVVTVEQSVATGAAYGTLINTFVTASTIEYRVSVTDPCGHDYGATYDVTPMPIFPITLVSYEKDGRTITDNQVFANQGEVDDYFESIGWTVNSSNDYSISDSVLWGNFNFLYSGISFHTAAVIDSAETAEETISKIDTIENCGTIYKYTETSCVWGSTSSLYTYYIVTVLSTPGTPLANYFPQTGVLISYNGTTITKDFATATEFIDYMESLGWSYLGTDNNVFVLQNTEDGWNFIVFPSDITMSIQQYVSKINLERTCTERNVVAAVVPLIPTPSPIQSALICKVEKSIVSNGCKMVRYSRIGRNIQSIMDNQIKLLLMKAALSMYPDDDAVYDLDCYFTKRLANLR